MFSHPGKPGAGTCLWDSGNPAIRIAPPANPCNIVGGREVVVRVCFP